jgi:hypothetical protein
MAHIVTPDFNPGTSLKKTIYVPSLWLSLSVWWHRCGWNKFHPYKLNRAYGSDMLMNENANLSIPEGWFIL